MEYLNLSKRHRIIINLLSKIFHPKEKLNILDLASGHNFPILKNFEDNNDGLKLSNYLAEKHNVTAYDQSAFQLFEKKKKNLRIKNGLVTRVEKYFPKESFDLIITSAFFGYPSSRNGRRPNYQKEFSVMEQAYNLTKKDGFQIHLLSDGYWQLNKSDLLNIGYDVKKYLNEELKFLGDLENKEEITKNLILLKKW